MIAPSLIALLALAAFVAGLVDAIAGGGGLVTVPALLAAGLPPHVALATNKGQACFGAVSSFLSFLKHDGIDRRRAPIGFLFGLLGSLVGARVVLLVRPEPLKPIVLVLLLVAAAFVLWPRRAAPPTPHAPSRLLLVPIAFTLGFYDGFFGPGTGTILLVAFVVVFGDSLTRASGNAKVVNLASNLAAVAIFMWRGTIVWSIAIPMAAANAAGAFVGARLAVKRGDRFIKPLLVLVVLALLLKVARDLFVARG